MDTTEIRSAREHELPDVAGLRWRWGVENGTAPAISRTEFVDRFTAWARESQSTHNCLVVVRDRTVIGMAWLATVPRVPTPRSPARASGDMQCVYLKPEYRNSGLGGRLIDAVLSLAHERGCERVTVHSSARAISAYTRHGFSGSARLLQAQLA